MATGTRQDGNGRLQRNLLSSLTCEMGKRKKRFGCDIKALKRAKVTSWSKEKMVKGPKGR